MNELVKLVRYIFQVGKKHCPSCRLCYEAACVVNLNKKSANYRDRAVKIVWKKRKVITG